MSDTSRPHNIHDAFFRSMLENQQVALDFIRQYFPKDIILALDANSLRLIKNTYIDKDLKATTSDLVFCCKLANKEAYLCLLIEHQSSPDKMMPVRAYHYLFNVLNSFRKQYPDQAMPAVFTLVFYHGEQTPYPYSLKLEDCFDDPLNIMSKVFDRPLSLVDVNQLSDDELKQQEWVGPMAMAMKHIRKRDMTHYALDILASLRWNIEKSQGDELLQQLLLYLYHGSKIIDLKKVIHSTVQIGEPIRRRVMTLAEQLEEKGMKRGMKQGMQQGMQKGIQQSTNDMAIKMLKEGTDLAFISRMTGLSLEEIKQLAG